MPAAPEASAFDAVIRRRRTTKRFADLASTTAPTTLDDADRRELQRMLECAGHAPFHKRAHDSHRTDTLPSPVPWRFHVLEREACLGLNGWLKAQADDQPDGPWGRAWASKIPMLLGAAGALVIVTWLPDPSDTGEPELSRNNVEHVAAAAAATQNLLLLAEAAGWSSYWSSGGVLREDAVFVKLGIGSQEQLLGAILLAPAVFPADKEVSGGLHDQRGRPEDWMRRVVL